MSTDKTIDPLTIAIVGPGKIGSIFASRLARVDGHDVTVVARPGSARLDQLRRDGGIVEVGGERAAVRVLDALDEETPYDLLIVTLLDRQTYEVLPSLRRSAARRIQFMDPEALSANGMAATMSGVLGRPVRFQHAMSLIPHGALNSDGGLIPVARCLLATGRLSELPFRTEGKSFRIAR